MRVCEQDCINAALYGLVILGNRRLLNGSKYITMCSDRKIEQSSTVRVNWRVRS
jgi:hypothetical protein